MHIRWLVDWDTPVSELESSPLASHRYRAAYPVRALRARGHTVDIMSMLQAREDLSSDALVIGKLFLDPDRQRLKIRTDLLLEAAARYRCIADINDNHFATANIADYWKKLCGLVDVCTVCSKSMADVVREHTKAPIFIVGDPVASPKGRPRTYKRGIFTKKPLKIAWYGVGKNFPAFGDAAYAIMARPPGVPVEFHVVTAKHPKVDGVCRVFSQKYAGRASMTFHEWGAETQWQIVADCDLVLIPSDPDDPKKSVKSANRLTDAIYAGRYVIASPVPAYLPYADVATITDDIPAAIQQYVSDPGSALARLKVGQAKVEHDCGADAIADQWLGAFNA